jgi:hypothetical protein
MVSIPTDARARGARVLERRVLNLGKKILFGTWPRPALDRRQTGRVPMPLGAEVLPAVPRPERFVSLQDAAGYFELVELRRRVMRELEATGRPSRRATALAEAARHIERASAKATRRYRRDLRRAPWPKFGLCRRFASWLKFQPCLKSKRD